MHTPGMANDSIGPLVLWKGSLGSGIGATYRLLFSAFPGQHSAQCSVWSERMDVDGMGDPRWVTTNQAQHDGVVAEAMHYLCQIVGANEEHFDCHPDHPLLEQVDHDVAARIEGGGR